MVPLLKRLLYEALCFIDTLFPGWQELHTDHYDHVSEECRRNWLQKGMRGGQP